MAIETRTEAPQEMALARPTEAAMVANPYPTEAEWTMLRQIGKDAHASGLIPTGIKTPEAAVLILMIGRELGIGPMEAFRSIAVVGNRPCLEADLMKALIARARAGRIEVVEEKWDPAKGDGYITMRAVRTDGFGGGGEFTFSMDDAKRAGLAAKDNWKNYPRLMMEHRCSAALARRFFPDIIRGMHDPSEVRDGVVMDAEFEVVGKDDTPPARDEDERVGKKAADAFWAWVDECIAKYPQLEGIQERVRANLKKTYGVDELAKAPRIAENLVREFVGRQMVALGEQIADQEPAATSPTTPAPAAPPTDTQDAAVTRLMALGKELGWNNEDITADIQMTLESDGPEGLVARVAELEAEAAKLAAKGSNKRQQPTVPAVPETTPAAEGERDLFDEGAQS